MSKIYLVNVGANTAHASKARSPIFDNGTFRYVSFPKNDCAQSYPAEVEKYVKNAEAQRTHLDPEWSGLTYGDNCSNGRGGALINLVPGDWLLFWALLWHVRDEDNSVWDSVTKGWYLIAALKVSHILKSDDMLESLTSAVRDRVKHNAHVVAGSRVEGRAERREKSRVFIGDPQVSQRFSRAVSLGVEEEPSLLQQVVFTADGRRLEWNSSPKWNSSTRGCRMILNCENSDHFERIAILEKAIKSANPEFAGFLSLK